jgi:hypothetical protein
MQCSLTITPHYDQPADGAFRPLGDGPRVLSALTEHPGITDAWGAFQDLLISAAATLGSGLVGGGVTAAAVGSAALKWAIGELNNGDNPKYGAVNAITLPASAQYWCKSQDKLLVDWGDQLRVSFRAWSEDEIKSGADGHVEQPPGINSGIADQGGGFHKTSGTFFYDRSFLVPLRRLPVGIYGISFGAIDDGFWYNVGVSEVLFIKVEENQYPRPPAKPVPVTIGAPSSADMRQLLSAFKQARGSLQAVPANAAPKKSRPRLDGRAPISLEAAMAIPFDGQAPAATPQMSAPTVLPDAGPEEEER